PFRRAKLVQILENELFVVLVVKGFVANVLRPLPAMVGHLRRNMKVRFTPLNKPEGFQVLSLVIGEWLTLLYPIQQQHICECQVWVFGQLSGVGYIYDSTSDGDLNAVILELIFR